MVDAPNLWDGCGCQGREGKDEWPFKMRRIWRLCFQIRRIVDAVQGVYERAQGNARAGLFGRGRKAERRHHHRLRGSTSLLIQA